MLFMLLLCEDSLMIHERIGARIGTYLHFPSIRSMEPAQLGEIVVAAGEGGTFFIALVLTLRTASHASRRLTFALLVGLFALAGFGVIVDAINSMASRRNLDQTGARFSWRMAARWSPPACWCGPRGSGEILNAVNDGPQRD
jgi:hypothetical protein